MKAKPKPPTRKAPAIKRGAKKTAPPAKKVAKKRAVSTNPPKLTIRLERFAELIAAGRSGTEAWIEAGHKVSREVAKASASRALTYDNVKARIAELRAPQTAKTMLSRDLKRELLAQMALTAGAKLQDRIRAIEVDAKIAGHFEPDRTEIEVGPRTLQSIKERAQHVASTLASHYTPK